MAGDFARWLVNETAAAALFDSIDDIPEAPPGTFDNTWSDEPPIVLRFQPREEAERWLRGGRPVTHPPAPRVSVDGAALDAFIAYADQERDRADSQFCASAAEHERSAAEFRGFVNALDIKPGED